MVQLLCVFKIMVRLVSKKIQKMNNRKKREGRLAQLKKNYYITGFISFFVGLVIISKIIF